MRILPWFWLIFLNFGPGVAAQTTLSEVGVVVMAHGGDADWNAAVEAAVLPLSERTPTAIAFGMAEPEVLRVALGRVRRMGVERVAVVRLFMSGRSFEEQTRYLLGLDESRPGWFMTREGVDPDSVHPIEHGLEVATHERGLMGSPHAAGIVMDRIDQASVRPRNEAVLLIAHGMGDDGENEGVKTAMERIAQALRTEGFASVEVATLREDWPDQRELAESRIRGLVSAEASQGRRMIVTPFRLSGFGPYATVLEGLAYVPTEGLLPHRAISQWLKATAGSIACAQGWSHPFDTCDSIRSTAIQTPRPPRKGSR